MPTLNEIVKVNLSSPQPTLAEGDFSTPAIFTTDTPDDPSFSFWRKYTGEQLASVAEDFGTGSNTYKAVSAMLSQDNKPANFVIVKRAAAVAQVKTITFDKDLTANCRITGTVNGVAIAQVDFDTDQETTMDNFALALEDITGIASAVPSSTPFRVMTVTSTVEYGLDMSFTVTGISNPPVATIATTTAGRTIVDDILELQTKPVGWFVGLTVQKLDAILLGLARTTQAIDKDFVYQESSSDITGNVAGNIQGVIKGQSLSTFSLWHGIDTEYADFAFVGQLYTTTPYVANAPYRTLIGVTPSPTDATATGYLTQAQESTLINDLRMNVYRDIVGASNVYPGIRSDGTWWNERRDLMYLKNQIQIDIYSYFRSKPKVTFSDATLTAIGTIIQKHADKAVVKNDIGLFDPTVGVRVVSPQRTDFTANQISSGKATGYKLYGTLAGSLINIELDIITSR